MDFRHTHRLVVVLLIVGLVAVLARWTLVPPTFGQYGVYRGQAPIDARDRTLRHQDNEACGGCHQAQAEARHRGTHQSVSCEACHGAGLKHARWHKKRNNVPGKQRGEAPKEARLRVDKDRRWCLVCHQKLRARPAWLAQVDPAAHLKDLGVKDAEVVCSQCHDPHSPLHLAGDVRQAAAHPVIQTCGDCHQDEIAKSTADKPADSPHRSLFTCDHCHKAQAKLAADSSHSDLRCTQCHRLIRDSELSARMVRDGGPGFCLLCHAAGEFRGDNSPPSITWPEHREENGGDEDADKLCVDCHRDAIHHGQD